MLTVADALRGINAYPIPFRTLVEAAGQRGVDINEEITQEGLRGKAYNLCKADLLLWLSYAPDISQGGQSYSFTDEQRAQLRSTAKKLYDEYGEESNVPVATYGYKGDRL